MIWFLAGWTLAIVLGLWAWSRLQSRHVLADPPHPPSLTLASGWAAAKASVNSFERPEPTRRGSPWHEVTRLQARVDQHDALLRDLSYVLAQAGAALQEDVQPEVRTQVRAYVARTVGWLKQLRAGGPPSNRVG